MEELAERIKTVLAPEEIRTNVIAFEPPDGPDARTHVSQN
jgi:hypothetical protein